MKRERVLKVVLVIVGLLFCAGIYPLMLCAGDDAQRLRHSRHLLAACVPQPVSEPEPDRVHGMVELRPRSAYGGAGVP